MTVHLCFVWLSEQTVTSALYIFNKLVFVTEVESVYCAVRTVCIESTLATRTQFLGAFRISAVN